jgi:DNA-binding MarR family transcriptional regulator
MTEIDHVAGIQAQWARERPDLDVTPQGIIGRMHRLAAHLTDELVAVYAEHGLTEGDFDVLATLRRSGPPYACNAGELAAHTMITTGGMTKRLDRLEQRGLVTRRPSKVDARGRVVALTDEGADVIDAAFADHAANERRLVDMLPAPDRAALEEILTKWLSRFE